MAKYLVDEETMTALANATRGQTGGSEQLSPSDMTNEINGMVNYLIEENPRSGSLVVFNPAIEEDYSNYSLIRYLLHIENWLIDVFGIDLNGLNTDTYEVFIDDVSIKKGSLKYAYHYAHRPETTYYFPVLEAGTMDPYIPYYLINNDGNTHTIRVHVEITRAAKVFEFDKEATFTAASQEAINELKAQIAADGRISIDSREDCPELALDVSTQAIDEACNNFIED